MAGPYKLVHCLIKIDTGAGFVTVGVLEAADMELIVEGGIVHYYGSRTGKHARGGKRATLSMTRWYKTDDDTSLLFDLVDQELNFVMTAELEGVSGSTITLSDCQCYSYRPRMGGPNDIMGETVTGEAAVWVTGPTD